MKKKPTKEDLASYKEYKKRKAQGEKGELFDGVMGQLKRAYSTEGSIKAIAEFEAVQGRDGNWNYDPYMHGYYNGIELCLALLQQRAPRFRSAPKQWIYSKKTRTKSRAVK